MKVDHRKLRKAGDCKVASCLGFSKVEDGYCEVHEKQSFKVKKTLKNPAQAKIQPRPNVTKALLDSERFLERLSKSNMRKLAKLKEITSNESMSSDTASSDTAGSAIESVSTRTMSQEPEKIDLTIEDRKTDDRKTEDCKDTISKLSDDQSLLVSQSSPIIVAKSSNDITELAIRIPLPPIEETDYFASPLTKPKDGEWVPTLIISEASEYLGNAQNVFEDLTDLIDPLEENSSNTYTSDDSDCSTPYSPRYDDNSNHKRFKCSYEEFLL